MEGKIQICGPPNGLDLSQRHHCIFQKGKLVYESNAYRLLFIALDIVLIDKRITGTSDDRKEKAGHLGYLVTGK